MDAEDVVISVLVLLLIGSALFLFCLIASAVLDGIATSQCIVQGYDGGDYVFVSWKTYCYNIITPAVEEVREYFLLEK
jgi:hypothetical protein